MQHVSSIVTELKKITDTLQTEQPSCVNEYEIFGRSVAAQLMTLSKLNAIKAQEKIQSVLTSFKLQELNVFPQMQSAVPSPAYTDSSSTTYFVNTPESSTVHEHDQYENSSDILKMAFANI